MRVLLVSIAGEGCWFATQLERAGHSVDVAIKHDEFADVLKGLIHTPLNLGSPQDYDLCLFDLTGEGKLADQCRVGTPTIGDSSLADKLEHDRTFGLDYMTRCGIKVPEYVEFNNPADALRLIRKTKKRYVYKASGSNVSCATSYVSKNAQDMEGYLETLFKQTPSHEFILQEFVSGTEVSTEMWVNETGYYAINHTLEEKKLLSGGLGPNCGCAGNVVWMPEKETTLFTQGLGRAANQLISDGYVGMIDLNAIVADGQVWGLEWTPRIGYEGTCNLSVLLNVEFGEFLRAIASNERPPEVSAKYGFAATIRVYVPPYPTEGTAKMFKQGIPLDGIAMAMLPRFFLYDARLKENSESFETAGLSGWIGSPIGTGETIGGAFQMCKDMIAKLRIPDMGYRNDVPESVAKRYRELESDGWLRVDWKSNDNANESLVAGRW
jgi:phosphoribosylamine-glycine ligase